MQVVASGAEKAALLRRLGGARTIAIGNGANDAPMFRAAGLALAAPGPRG